MKIFNLMYQFSPLKKGRIQLLERLVIPAEAGIQVSSTGSLFSQGQAWIPVFTGMTTWVRQQKNLFKELKFYNLTNSKGISVLFLVIAMMLMVTIGYVFSYLIPTKQKSVRFPIYSTQAFFIAQSGVEFAIRYASDQGWRGATDGVTFDLDRLDPILRNLGNGRFTLNYDRPSDTLTSTGQITGSSENRVVSVSNFTPFLGLIFDPTSPAPRWCRTTRRARFYIKNETMHDITLYSFSATWTGGQDISSISLGGTQKYSGTYSSGSTAVNFNRPTSETHPHRYLIPQNGVVEVLVVWSGVTNGSNIAITFYTGTLGTGTAYKFNLDPSNNGLPAAPTPADC